MDSAEIDPRWYVLRCRQHQEGRAEENLRNQAYRCYRPVHRVERLRKGRRVVVEGSLFPGYLFIRLCRQTSEWSRIRSTRGVLHIISFNNQPTEVPEDVINALHERLNDEPAKSLFEPGQAVRIVDGPFKELDAIFERECGEERAMILLSMLHKHQSVKIPLRSITKVP